MLQAFAYSETNIEYCQGMNYFTGYLLYIYEDEALCYWFLKMLVDKYALKKLFIKNIPLLHICFFQMDRLCATFIPNFLKKCKSLGIHSSIFISNWIMTLLTSAFQSSNDNKIPPLLLMIWDALLIDGWKGFMKAMLFIIKKLDERIILLPQDEILKILTCSISEEIFNNNKYLDDFWMQISKWKIRDTDLGALQEDYEDLKAKPQDMKEGVQKGDN